MAKFVEYLDPTKSIEERLCSAFEQNAIALPQQEKLRVFLGPLKEKDDATYRHSVRVGLLTAEIAGFMSLNPLPALYAGLLHDVGKAQIPVEVLRKEDGWKRKDKKLMDSHVLLSYKLIRDAFDWSAEVLYWHHKFQPKPYPDGESEHFAEYSFADQTTIRFYGRLLALADSFDAFHRVNNKHGEKQLPDGENIKRKMLEHNKDLAPLVAELYKANILTTAMFHELPKQTESKTAESDRAA